MGVPADKVEVAIQGNVGYVRVHGRGTFKVAPGLKQFGVAATEQGCRRLVVEMADCLGMDSTFMGVLAGLAVVQKKGGGDVVLRHVSDKNAFLVRMLGLSHLVVIDQGGPSADVMPAQTSVLDTGSSKQVLNKTMIAAHETLVEVAPENIVKFKDVLTFLKEDLQRAGEPANTDKAP